MSIPTGLNEHFTGNSKHRRPKKAFETEFDAWEFIERAGVKGKVPYLCSFCGKYHIGG